MQSYDQKIGKLFYYWLLISFVMIFTIIIVGGLTRLTNSGLSITEWELFKGLLPPTNIEKWNEYFSLYKNIPQYNLINFNMTLDEFKIIFYWEYFHRILGRLLGLFFLIPLIFFFITKNKEYLFTCLIILFLIIFQGIIGWYMVKSGLVNNVTVSHYRLSLHLGTAIVIFTSIFWVLLNLKKGKKSIFFINKKDNYFFYFLFIMIFFQIILGAFVSGLDAGRLYQTWPLMNYNYFPDDVSINNFKDFFNFNNHGLVQFYHRNLAYLISIYIVIAGLYIYINDIKKIIKPFNYVILILVFQIILGITTLTSGLNIYLASTHQICSLLLILSVINLYYEYIK